MDDMKGYINAFFKLLNIESDSKQGHFFKEYIQAAVMEFLDDEIKKEAYDVYSLFLDIYRVNISGEKSFIDLLDVLREYEENAAVLNDKQREVVERRFGLHGYENSTLEEVANELGVTRERVRQIQMDALRRLRDILEKDGYSVDAIFK